MSAYPASAGRLSATTRQDLSAAFRRIHVHRGLAIGSLIVAALVAFEVFNFGTTEFALTDLLGNLHFGAVSWATVLALAFCGIDFAGLVRLFTPSSEAQEPAEVWYLMGAWFLAATMNATLTWWGVSLALLNHQSLGGAIVGAATLQKAAPVFVAVLVWIVRVLIIGALSLSGRRIFSLDARRLSSRLRFAPAHHGATSQPASRPTETLRRTVIPPGPSTQAAMSAGAALRHG
ncbi:MAG: hypothetical protein WD906_02010 [Anaerolineales bacterium]